MNSAYPTSTSAPTYPASISRRPWWQGDRNGFLRCFAGMEDINDEGCGIVEMDDHDRLDKRESIDANEGQREESSYDDDEKTEESFCAPSTIYVARVSRPEGDKCDNADDPVYNKDKLSPDFGQKVIKDNLIEPLKKVKQSSKYTSIEETLVEPKLKTCKKEESKVGTKEQKIEEDWAPSSKGDDIASQLSLDFGQKVIKDKLMVAPLNKVKQSSKYNTKEMPLVDVVEPKLKTCKEEESKIGKKEQKIEEDWAPSSKGDDIARQLSLDFGQNVIKGKLIMPLKKVKQSVKCNAKEETLVEPKLCKEAVSEVGKKEQKIEEDLAPSSKWMMQVPPAKSDQKHFFGTDQTQCKDEDLPSTKKDTFEGAAVNEVLNAISLEGVNDLCGQDTEQVTNNEGDQPCTGQDAEKVTKNEDEQRTAARFESNVDVVQSSWVDSIFNGASPYLNFKIGVPDEKPIWVDSIFKAAIPDLNFKMGVLDEKPREIEKQETVEENSIIHEVNQPEITDGIPSSSGQDSAPLDVPTATVLTSGVNETYHVDQAISLVSTSGVLEKRQEDDTTSQGTSLSSKYEKPKIVSTFWPYPFKRGKRRKRKVVSSPLPVHVKMQAVVRSESWEEREFERLTISDARFIPDISWRELKLHSSPLANPQTESPAMTREMKSTNQAIMEREQNLGPPVGKDSNEVESVRSLELRDSMEIVKTARRPLTANDDSNSEDQIVGDKLGDRSFLPSLQDAYIKATMIANKFGGCFDPFSASSQSYGVAKDDVHGPTQYDEEREMNTTEDVNGEPGRKKLVGEEPVRDNAPFDQRNLEPKGSTTCSAVRSSLRGELQPGSLLL